MLLELVLTKRASKEPSLVRLAIKIDDKCPFELSFGEDHVRLRRMRDSARFCLSGLFPEACARHFAAADCGANPIVEEHGIRHPPTTVDKAVSQWLQATMRKRGFFPRYLTTCGMQPNSSKPALASKVEAILSAEPTAIRPPICSSSFRFDG